MTVMTTGLGARKAAIVLVRLGKERAATVLAHMSDEEVEAVSAEVATLASVEPGEANDVITEFGSLLTARQHMLQGGMDLARDLLGRALGEDRAEEAMQRLNAMAVQLPFQFLQRADPTQLRSFINEEHPQVIALVLAHMSAEKASLVLSGLSPERQADVAHRIAVMGRANPETVRTVEAMLERRLSSVLQPSDSSRVGGVVPLVNIINRADRSTERQIVEGLESLDAGLAEEVRSRMFMFEDIVNLSDRDVQQVLRQVDTAELALALKGVSDQVRDKITGNLSERAAENVLDEIEILGPVRLTQVEEAQQAVIRTIRSLEERGEIVVRRGGEDEFVD
ncbi:flagellar motor switch protein FliG [Nocardioides sp. Root122]|uniref:flagellar motor switch protein FliG n=1 Tax=Nocardioides TaxID=1839 RepID=UPI0007028491|nr:MULTISPECIES: flagellar motor switch protein FliG [Nocardioides]KQV63233.1 flagellar motor switch protein FliG [Nocardioides sp. Root122]MCK9824398.1 flagellar motor switch protein FliG [Nocardioides cavernae]